MENTRINVERETFKSNGKEYFSYFIKGVVRGRNVKAAGLPLYGIAFKAVLGYIRSRKNVRHK